MIHIASQDSMHQYDENGNAITTWNDKCCNWIVNEEYEKAFNNDEIDWWGNDNDFPRGCTMEYQIKNFGDPDKLPDITLIMEWETESDYRKMGPGFDYSKYNYPVTVTRNWGYINCTEEEAIERFVTNPDSYYNKIAIGSTDCILKYNEKVIYQKTNND